MSRRAFQSILLSLALSLAGCHGTHKEHDHDHEGHDHAAEAVEEHDHEHGHHDHEGHEEGHEGHDHNGAIELNDEQMELFGVVLDTVRAGNFHQVIKTAGHVVQAGTDDAVVSAQSSGIVSFASGISAGSEVSKGAVVARINATAVAGGDSQAAARSALKAAETELARVQSLYDIRMATVAELQAAQAAVEQARAAYNPAAAGSATAPISGTITSLLVREGQYVTAGEAVATIAKGDAALLRADLPARYYSAASDIIDMTVDIPGREPFGVKERGGRRLSKAPATDASDAAGAYIPLYFSTSGTGAPVGTVFTAYLIGAPRSGVVSVPVSALSEQQGAYYVYRRHEGEHFDKTAVTVGASDGRRVEIVSGIAPGDEIVVSGTPALRLAETSKNAPQGHTHNH